jgi:hypothetical protein
MTRSGRNSNHLLHVESKNQWRKWVLKELPIWDDNFISKYRQVTLALPILFFFSKLKQTRHCGGQLNHFLVFLKKFPVSGLEPGTFGL